MNRESPPFSWHFSLGRIPVVVEPMFWLTTVMLGTSLRDGRLIALWVAVCFISILVHELGHAVVAMALGSAVSVRLYWFGGLTYHEGFSRWRSVAVSLAGPFAGFLLAGVAYGLENWVWPPTTWMGNVFYSLVQYVNVWWGILNLLPVPPLDGGHVSQGVLGPTRRRMAFLLGLLTACGVVAWALTGKQYYVVFLFGFLGYGCYWEYQNARDVKPLAPAPKPEPEPDALERGWKALRAGDELEADRLGRLALVAAKKEAEVNAARDLLAWVALAGGNARAALSHLEKVQPPEAARPLTLAMAYETAGMADRALPHALAAVEKERTEAAAALAVRLLVARKQLDEAERLSREFAWKAPATRDARLADVAAARGDFGAAAALYAAAFEAGQRADDAYEAARSHARAGQVDRATEWLTRALEAGYDDLETVAQEPALAQVRTAPDISKRLARK